MLNGGFVLVRVTAPPDGWSASERNERRSRDSSCSHPASLSEPIEDPADPDLVVDTRSRSPVRAARRVIEFLEGSGYLASPHRAQPLTRVGDGGLAAVS